MLTLISLAALDVGQWEDCAPRLCIVRGAESSVPYIRGCTQDIPKEE